MNFSLGGGIFLASDHAGMEEVELSFAHGSFQADKEAVIKIGHVRRCHLRQSRGY